jgi:hypothetical protein
MRKIALLVVVALATACGSSSDPAPTGSTITGTVGNAAFTSAAQLALVLSGDACTIAVAPGVQLGVSLALIDVANVAGTCSDAPTCISNSTNLGLVIAKVHVPTAALPSVTAPPFTTGTYQFADLNNLAGLAGITPDASGNISIFTGGVEILGAAPACTTTGGYGISGGTLTVSSVTGSTITGSVSVNLVSSTGAASGTLSGTFTTATNCTPSPAPSACTVLSDLIPAT